MMSFLINDIQFTSVNARPVCGQLESMNRYTGEQCQDHPRKFKLQYIAKKNYALYIWFSYSTLDHH